MVLKEDKERIRTLLSETIALMCKSGLHFKAEFSVEALVGITLDHGDEFFLSIRETVLSDVAPPTEPTCSPILSDNNDSCSDDNADVKKSGRKSSQVRHVVGRDPARPSDGAEREGSPVTDDWSSAAADENSGVGTRWTGHKRPKSRPSDRASPPKRRHVDEETGGEGEERGAGREAGRGVVKLEASQSEAQDSEDDCVYVKDEPLSDRGEGDTDTAELNWDTSDLSYSFGSAPSSYDPNSTANASMVSSFTGPTVDGVGAPGIVETGPPPPGHGHRIPISYHQARGPLWKSVPDVQFSGMLPVDGSTGGLDMLNSASTSDSSLNQPHGFPLVTGSSSVVPSRSWVGLAPQGPRPDDHQKRRRPVLPFAGAPGDPDDGVAVDLTHGAAVVIARPVAAGEDCGFGPELDENGAAGCCSKRLLKQHPELYKRYRELQAERARQRRKNRSEAERLHDRELARLRQQRHRAKLRQHMGLQPEDEAGNQPHAVSMPLGQLVTAGPHPHNWGENVV